jgi:hypothetical protein
MRRSLFACLVLALLALAAPARAQVAPEPPDPVAALRARAAELDAQIAAAQAQLDAWQRQLQGWSVRLDRAERAVELARRTARDRTSLQVDQAENPALRKLMGSERPSRGVLLALQQRVDRVRADPEAAIALGGANEAQDQVASLQRARADVADAVVLLTATGAAAVEPDAGTWVRLFLSYIGAPTCEENLVLLVAWQAQESTSARFNPLATTHVMPGATAMNSVGVRNYVSVAQGLQGTLATLEAPIADYGYAPILASLRACAPAETTAWYVNASAWCRGCTDGGYLTRLLPAVRADYATYAART